MKDEVKFSNFAETGQHINAVDLETFIKLFVNHRPVYGIGKNNIQEAFQALISLEGARGGSGLSKGKTYQLMRIDDLIRLLREEGECMGQAELEECLGLLVGDSNFKTALPQDVQADDFAENILGFEEVEEVEGEEGVDMTAGGPSLMGGSYNAGMGVIPEEHHV